MNEFERASELIAQSGIDALRSQLLAGLLTADEYHTAVTLMQPDQEVGPRCIYCEKAAYLGNTCADHADRRAVAAVARKHRETRNV